MFLAQEFDAVEDGRPFVSAERPRVIYPDLRARLYGYLTAAAEATPGFRTDGVWVWPESLATHVRAGGAGPQWQFYSHIQEQHFLLPDSVSSDALAEAARTSRATAMPDPPLDGTVTYFTDGRSVHHVVATNAGETWEAVFFKGGWERTTLFERSTPEAQARAAGYGEVSGLAAAELVNARCDEMHAELLARAEESEQDGAPLRWARVFDGEAPDGTPWFSSSRLRIREPVRRQRIAAYLRSGRLVMRAAGGMPDPLSPGGSGAVPMSYRTDGTWLWPDALAYYLERRGVAPELALLCHIEESGYLPPANVAPEAVRAGASLLRAGPPSPRPRPRYVYFHDGEGVVARALEGDVWRADALGWDLAWTDTEDLSRQRYRGSEYGYEETTEAEVVRVIDEHWAEMSDGRELDWS